MSPSPTTHSLIDNQYIYLFLIVMTNTQREEFYDQYAEFHMELRCMFEKRSVEQVLAWLTYVYGTTEAVQIYKTYRQVEERARLLSQNTQ